METIAGRKKATLNIVHGNWPVGQSGQVKKYSRKTVDDKGVEFTSDFIFYPDNLPNYGFLVSKEEVTIV